MLFFDFFRLADKADRDSDFFVYKKVAVPKNEVS